MNKAIECLTKNYANFSSRASRSEYWSFVLFTVIAIIGLILIDIFTGTYNVKNGLGLLSSLFSLAIFIPNIAVSVRRLHDIDKSGWWYLINFIPLLGPIWLIVLFCTKGTEGQNRFGEESIETR